MNRLHLIILAGAAFLSACTSTQPQPSAPWQQAEAVRQECHAKLDAGDYPSQASMMSGCINPQILQIYEQAKSPDLDLVLLINAKRLELAEQVDAGQITVGQASVTLAQLAVNMTDIASKRAQQALDRPSLQLVTQDAFSPRQGATELVVQTINGARQSIYVAAYAFTSKPIADTLIAAHQRGVDVRVLFDKRQRTNRHSLASYMATHDIAVRFDTKHALMHDKFIIVDDKTLETGSFNFTDAAENHNAENVIVIGNDPQTVDDYRRQWERLWNESQ